MELNKIKKPGLTIKQTNEILRQFKDGKTRSELSTMYKCHLSTISRILKNKNQYRQMEIENANLQRKRMRKGSHDQVDEAVSIWFKQMRAKNAIISGPMVCERAVKFAQMMNVENFDGNSGWLHRWKIRENISFQKVHGESADADHQAGREWLADVWPSLSTQYDTSNIYNADESASAALPRGTLSYRNETVHGMKISKQRLTLLFLCNSDGTDKRVFTIGTAKKPHSFRGNKIPLPYYNSKKAWMNSKIWNEILIDLNLHFMRERKHVLLLVDNATCHKLNGNLSNIKIVFLTPNTTSVIQPLDQGIIHCFKMYFRKCMVRKQLLAMENGITLKDFSASISVFEAIKIIKRSWWLVSPNTISNCFRKAGFTCPNSSLLDDDVAVLSTTAESIDLPIPENEFNDLPCYGELTEEEIVAVVAASNVENIELSDEDDEERSINETVGSKPSHNEAIRALSILQRFFENTDNSELGSIFDLIEEELLKKCQVNFTQKKLTHFFRK